MPTRSSRLARLSARIRSSRSAKLQLEALETRVVPTILGNNFFLTDSPWQQNIANAPVATNSGSVINAIMTNDGVGNVNLSFGQDTQSTGTLAGIPYNVVHGTTQSLVNVVIDANAAQSDVGPAPIPANAVIEGDAQNGPTVGLANRGDSHLIVYDVDNNIAYEFFHASRPSENTDGQWHADQETIWNFNTNNFRTIGFASADTAGLSILAGLARPDEGLPVGEGGQGVINHPLEMTLPSSAILDQFLYPATHATSIGGIDLNSEVPLGARFRLKASVDISTLNPESQVIAQALKDYGAIVADTGSNFNLLGSSYSVDANGNFGLTWNNSDLQDSVHGLASLNFSDFEMVDLTPVVTGLSTSTSATGTTITVTGQNFSGSAGHLQVLFGGTLSPNVQVVDDSHVVAEVPAGSGTVGVQVQSGVNDSGVSGNRNSPIFGYGTSVPSAADNFTFNTSDPNVVIVNQLYQDILGRSADAGGLAYWANLLANGAPREGVGLGFTHSFEYYTQIVTADYQQLLGRAPDFGGLQYWAGQLQLGMTDEGLQAMLLSSPEGYARAGNNNTAWVDSLYQTLLGRTAEAAGEGYWVAQLAGGASFYSVAYDIAVSAEADTIRVQADYQHYLARAATQAEVDSAISQFSLGYTDETLIAGLVGSDEYFHRFVP
jgi:hypothetical protein